MSELATTLESAGCQSVRTYIQSGNVIFASKSKSKRELAGRLSDATESQFGFRTKILLLSADEFRLALQHNPFPDAISEPKSLHYFFLDTTPDSPDMAGLAKFATPSERYELIGPVFYLHAPDGLSRSKLATSVERKLGVSATARNFSTIQALSSMLAEK